MKSDDLYRDDAGTPREASPAAIGHRAGHGVRRLLRALVVIVALVAGGLVLYGILQLFVCDLREIVFKGAPRRAIWLCR